MTVRAKLISGPKWKRPSADGSDAIETTGTISPSRVSEEICDILICPECRTRLRSGTANYGCAGCGRAYPVIRDIPRFVPDEDYAGSFGFEWTKHAQTQLDHAGSQATALQFRENTRMDPEELRGKLVLDAGCGMGRYAEVVSRYGARVIGVDLSRAVESARRNLADRKNVQIMQANLFKLPFPPATFDFIYSIGVLHHTPDCEAAFRGLVKLLKPGGTIVIWLYQGYNHSSYFMSDVYRTITTRLPARVLHTMCYISVPAYYVDAALKKIGLRRVAQMLRLLMPLSHHPDWRWRVLDTFDWYSPKYQSKHTYEEVFRWFESEGLVNNGVMTFPIGVSGQKPQNRRSKFL